MTKEDIVDLIAKVEERNVSPWTKHDYKAVLKRFYKCFRDSDNYPAEVRWIKLSRNIPNKIQKKEELKKNCEKVDFLAGLGFRLTDKEALEDLLKMQNKHKRKLECRVFNDASFHTKIYLFLLLLVFWRFYIQLQV